MPSAARAAASRAKGALSRGPVTAEGKARSRLNALKHGMAAATHMLVEGEDPAAFEALLAGLVEDLEPAGELEARLVHRLAVALWRHDRADRVEAAAFADTPKPHYRGPDGPFRGDHEAKVPLDRLNALRLYAAQAGREASRVMRELRLLRRERAEAAEAIPENEPERAVGATLGPADEPRGDGAGEGPPAPPAPTVVTPRGGAGPRVAATEDPARNGPEPPRLNRQQRRRLAALRRNAA